MVMKEVPQGESIYSVLSILDSLTVSQPIVFVWCVVREQAEKLLLYFKAVKHEFMAVLRLLRCPLS